MRKAALVIALVLAGLAGDAAAQPGMTPIEPAIPAAAEQGERLDERTALWLSLGGTAASWGLLALSSQLDDGAEATMGMVGLIGTYLAPSAGHWYAGSYLTRGLGVRTVAVASIFLGATRTVTACVDGGSCGGASELGPALLVGGLVLYAAGTIDDILAAPGKARRHNQRLRAMALAPMATPRGGGLAVAGAF
jgi:hypothetical protein